jgi:hypothetical protein
MEKSSRQQIVDISWKYGPFGVALARNLETKRNRLPAGCVGFASNDFPQSLI